MSDEEEEDEIRCNKKPIKPEYAFGVPLRQRIVYSDFAHLGPGMVTFACALAAHTDGGDLAKRPAARDSPKKRKPVKRDKKPPPGIRPSSKAQARGGAVDIPGSEPSPGKEPVEPCERPECNDVIQKILDTQLNNEIEREDIVQICEESILETEGVEEECKELEDIQKTINQDGAQLEENLQQLMEKLEKYEKRLSLQIQEKDEWNNKAQALEMERQRLTRRAKEVEAALSDALWSGKTTEAAVEKTASSMRIRHGDEAKMDYLSSSTPYGNLVRDDVMDFTERPKTVSIVPHYLLYDKGNMAPVSAVTNTDYEAFGETGTMSVSSRSRGPPSSPISRIKTLPNLNLSGGGGKQHMDDRSAAGRSRGGHKNRSDGATSVTSNSSWAQLDPVLYQERARTSWGREKKLGKVRVRNDPPGYKRAMLTAKGHPGIFNADEDHSRLGQTI
jgi:hypothetical protein